MNDTDLDIILAIADNRLTGQAKQDALVRIAADPELGEELAAQILAMDELKSLQPALMTSDERATLRANLIEQLHLAPAVPAAAVEPQRRPWWQPALALASGFALLLAIIVVPGMLPSGDDSGSDVVAIAPESTTITRAATSAADAGAPQDDGNVLTVYDIAEEDVAEFFSSSPAPSTATVPPTTKSAPLPGAGASEDDSSADTVDDDPEAASTFAAEANPQDVDLLDEIPLTTIVRADVEACLDLLAQGLPPGTLIPVAATRTGSEVVVHFGVEVVDGMEYSVSIDLASCTMTPLNP